MTQNAIVGLSAMRKQKMPPKIGGPSLVIAASFSDCTMFLLHHEIQDNRTSAQA